MAEQPIPGAETRAWLVSCSGATAGIQYELGDGVTCIGRGSQNNLVIQGPDVGSVSIQHLEIRREASGFRLRDLDSTNGTYLNGERITDAAKPLRPPATNSVSRISSGLNSPFTS